MSVSRKALCLTYGLIALLALIGTWGNNVAYLNQGVSDSYLKFWADTLANPASRSITVDIFFFGFAVFIWMILEARRLGMRRVWLYLVSGMLIAISVTVPVFLIHRERALASRDSSPISGTLGAADVAGLCAVGLATVAYAAIALIR